MSNKTGSERMIMTILEGHVAPEQWDNLRQTFAENSSHIPPQMVQTLLVQSKANPTTWQIIGIWHSLAALEEYRRSAATPGGVMMFRSVGAEPTLTILEIAASFHPAGTTA